MELAKPTTFRLTACGNPVTVIVLPTCGPPPPEKPSSTIWPGPVTQCPAISTASSTGPPADARPTSVSCPKSWPLHCVGTVAS